MEEEEEDCVVFRVNSIGLSLSWSSLRCNKSTILNEDFSISFFPSIASDSHCRTVTVNSETAPLCSHNWCVCTNIK